MDTPKKHSKNGGFFFPWCIEFEKLLDYISDEIRVIMNTEVALVILLDKERIDVCQI